MITSPALDYALTADAHARQADGIAERGRRTIHASNVLRAHLESARLHNAWADDAWQAFRSFTTEAAQ